MHGISDQDGPFDKEQPRVYRNFGKADGEWIPNAPRTAGWKELSKRKAVGEPMESPSVRNLGKLESLIRQVL